MEIKLDHAGIGEMLRSSEVAAAIDAIGEAVANIAATHESVTRHGMEIGQGPYTTDRAAYEVTIEHAGGIGVEMKYGVLSTAAAAEGLEFKGRHEGVTGAHKRRERSRKAREAAARRKARKAAGQ